MTQRHAFSSLENTRNGTMHNNITSLSTSRSNITNPASFEFSFILHTIKGAHFSEQSACVSVNGHSFVLSPRYKKNNQRFYGNGFLIYLPADEIIRFSIGIVTPENDNNKKNSKKTGFLHNFVRYSFVPPNSPIIQELTMETLGSSYIINATIGITPSIKCKSPLISKNPQKSPKRRSISPLRKTIPAKTRRGPSYNHNVRSQTQVARQRFPIKLQPKNTNENANEKEEQERSVSRLDEKRKSDQPTPFVTDVNTVE